jgi:hypothetical protein
MLVTPNQTKKGYPYSVPPTKHTICDTCVTPEEFAEKDKERMGVNLEIHLRVETNIRTAVRTSSLMKTLKILASLRIKWTIVYILKPRGVCSSS